MKQQKLFDISEIKPNASDKTCRTCEHRQPWEFSDKVFQYCGVRKSNRTQNGLLKIKCKTPACPLYELLKTKMEKENE